MAILVFLMDVVQPGEIGLGCPAEADGDIGETLKIKLRLRLATKIMYEKNRNFGGRRQMFKPLLRSTAVQAAMMTLKAG